MMALAHAFWMLGRSGRPRAEAPIAALKTLNVRDRGIRKAKAAIKSNICAKESCFLAAILDLRLGVGQGPEVHHREKLPEMSASNMAWSSILAVLSMQLHSLFVNHMSQ